MRSKIFAASADALPAGTPDDELVIAVSPREARRQLQVSLGLMALMAAASALLLAIHGLPQSTLSAKNQPAATKLVVQQPAFVRQAGSLAPDFAEVHQSRAPNS